VVVLDLLEAQLQVVEDLSHTSVLGFVGSQLLRLLPHERVLGLELLKELVVLRLRLLAANRSRNLASSDLVCSIQQVDGSYLIVLRAVVASWNLCRILSLEVGLTLP